MMEQSPQPLEKQNWLQLTSIQVGGAICLPLLLVGYELAKLGDPLTMGLSVLWGNLALFGLALIAGWMSAKRPFITVDQAAMYFGNQGKPIFALTIALSMLGWFAIQTQCMGGDVAHLHMNLSGEDVPQGTHLKESIIFILSVLMIAGAYKGLHFLGWIANLCVPLMLGTIGFAVYEVGLFPLFIDSSFLDKDWWSGKGVSLVLASSMAATIDLPTFYRHAEHPKAAVWASAANFLVATPLIQIAGMCLYYGTKAPTISQALAYDSGTMWTIWVVLFMLLAGWTTNNVNLYSASLSLKSLSKRLSYHYAMIAAGLIAIILAFTPAIEQFALVLDLMGIFVVAMGSVMFTAFILESMGLGIQSIHAWMAWGLGIAVGCSEVFWPQIGSGAPVLDTGIISLSVLLIIKWTVVILKPSPQLLMEEIES